MELHLTAIRGVTCQMGSPGTRHKWTHPSFTGGYWIYLSRRDGRL